MMFFLRRAGIFIADFFRYIYRKREAVTAALCFILLALAVSGAVKNSLVNNFETGIFKTVLPALENPKVQGIETGFAPFFFINLAVIVLCASCILMIYCRKKTRVLPGRAVPGAGPAITFAVIIQLIVIFLYLTEKGFAAQGILYSAELIVLGIYFYGKDRKNGINLRPGIMRARREKSGLLVFSAFLLILYMFDYTSWKYSFIGDEYAFYIYAKEIVSGGAPLRIFYEEGVYGHHPELASAWQALIMKIFGTGLFGWKLSAALIPALSVIPFYMWVKMVFNRRAAVFSAAGFGFSAVILGFARVPYDNIQAVFPFILSMLLAELAIRKNSSFWTFLAAAVMGLGCYTFYTSRLTIIVAAVYFMLHPLRKKFSGENRLVFSAVYISAIIFILINPDFLGNLMAHSVFGAGEMADESQKPLYVGLNFLRSLFAFLSGSFSTHFITGPLTGRVIAAGAVMGFVWAVLSFFRDWRARFLIAVYLILVFFTGAISQYAYPPVTRLYFLVPVIAIAASSGFSRVLFTVSSYFRKRRAAVKFFTAAVLILLAISEFYGFFVRMPQKFNFTDEALIIKYMTEKESSGSHVLITKKKGIMKLLSRLYGFSERFEVIHEGSGREEDAKVSGLKGKTLIISRDSAYAGDNEGIFSGEENVLRNSKGRIIFYLKNNGK